MGYDKATLIDANNELDKRLTTDREEWGNTISDLVQKIKHMSDLSDCQVQMLSYRQMLLERITEFKTIIYRRNASWHEYYKVKFIEYSVNYNIKLSGSEKVQFIKGDLCELRTQIDMLAAHVDYYQECIKTLDNMAFAIRNRIRLDDEQN